MFYKPATKDFFQVLNKSFRQPLTAFIRCFVGEGEKVVVEDCLKKAPHPDNIIDDPKEKSKSVSEQPEWVCATLEFGNESTKRDCKLVITYSEQLIKFFSFIPTSHLFLGLHRRNWL